MLYRMEALILAQLAPAVEAIRLSLHVLGASVWVGGQITVAGLVPTARQLGPDAPRRLGRAFSRLSWPAYAVLLATGVWNVVAVHAGEPPAWDVVLGIKIAIVLLAGLAAWLHGRAGSPTTLAVWGAVTSLASLAALVMGVFLAG
jgi:putative copper export protein